MKVSKIIDGAQDVIRANEQYLALLGINPLIVEGGNIVIDLAQSVIAKWGNSPRNLDVTQEEINSEADAAIARTRAKTEEYNKVDETEDPGAVSDEE